MEYVKGEVLQHSNGKTTIFHPVLTDEEKHQRHEALYNAAVRFAKVIEREKTKKGNEQITG